MAGVNKVIIVGHLGADPTTRSFQNGGQVVNLRVATSETWKDKTTGERRERTEWHSVAIFSEGLGKVASNYLRKGNRVYLEGKLQTRKWQDQQGNDRYSTEIVLNGYDANIVLLDKNEGGGGGDRRDDRPRGGAANGDWPDRGGATRSGFDHDLDDDVPF